MRRSLRAKSESQARLPAVSGQGPGWGLGGSVENAVGEEKQGGRGCVCCPGSSACACHTPCLCTCLFHAASPACESSSARLKPCKPLPTVMPAEILMTGSVPAPWLLPPHPRFRRIPGVQCPADAEHTISGTRGGRAVSMSWGRVCKEHP